MLYQESLVELGRRVLAYGGGTLEVAIHHDRTCAALAGGACYCAPTVLPIVTARRVETPAGVRLAVSCPYCGREHTHAPAPGARVLHCDTARWGDGYLLRAPADPSGPQPATGKAVGAGPELRHG